MSRRGIELYFITSVAILEKAQDFVVPVKKKIKIHFTLRKKIIVFFGRQRVQFHPLFTTSYFLEYSKHSTLVKTIEDWVK